MIPTLCSVRYRAWNSGRRPHWYTVDGTQWMLSLSSALPLPASPVTETSTHGSPPRPYLAVS